MVFAKHPEGHLHFTIFRKFAVRDFEKDIGVEIPGAVAELWDFETGESVQER